VQPYLGQEGGEVGHGVAVNLVVEVEKVPLRRRAGGQAAGQPPVQRPLGPRAVGDLLRVLPPLLQFAPPEAAGADVPVVDQDLVGVRGDLDVVVDGVGEPDVGLVG
jgi:hypothetical protein